MKDNAKPDLAPTERRTPAIPIVRMALLLMLTFAVSCTTYKNLPDGASALNDEFKGIWQATDQGGTKGTAYFQTLGSNRTATRINGVAWNETGPTYSLYDMEFSACRIETEMVVACKYHSDGSPEFDPKSMPDGYQFGVASLNSNELRFYFLTLGSDVPSTADPSILREAIAKRIRDERQTKTWQDFFSSNSSSGGLIFRRTNLTELPSPPVSLMIRADAATALRKKTEAAAKKSDTPPVPAQPQITAPARIAPPAQIPVEVTSVENDFATAALKRAMIGVIGNHRGFVITNNPSQTRLVLSVVAPTSGGVVTYGTTLEIRPPNSQFGIAVRGHVGFVDEDNIGRSFVSNAAMIFRLYEALFVQNEMSRKLNYIFSFAYQDGDLNSLGKAGLEVRNGAGR